MSDELNRKAVTENTKSIRDLTKAFREQAKAGRDSSADDENQKGTGIRAIDNKIDEIKEAFNNNTTVKFLKDPVGSIAGGMRNVLKPITSIGDSFSNAFKKIGGFFGGGKSTKSDKQMMKLLKKIERNTAVFRKPQMLQGILGGQEQSFSISNSDTLAEAVGTTVSTNFLRGTGFGKSVGALAKIQTTLALAPQAIAGATIRGVNFLAKDIKKTFADGKLGAIFQSVFGGTQSGLPEGFQELFDQQEGRRKAETEHRAAITPIFEAVRTGIDQLKFGINNMSNVIRQSVGLDPIEIGNEVADSLKESEAAKDQKIAESKKDEKNFRINQNEQLMFAFDKAVEKFGLKNVKQTIKGTSFNLVEFFKKMLAGGAGAVAARAAGVGAGIVGFFKAIGAGFMFLGANLPMFAKGAAALALMGASFIPFGGALMLINKALEGMTFKKIGMFATMLTTMGAAVAAFTAAVVFSGGSLFIGIAALAAAGAALIPFGYAMKLAGAGLDSAAHLFSQLAEVGWDKVGVAGDAIKDLAVSFRDLSFGGLIDKITGGGFSGFVKDLADFGTKATGITMLADAMERLATVIEPFKNMNFQTNIKDLLHNITKYGEKFDGQMWWDVNMVKASEGLDTFLSVMTKHFSANTNNTPIARAMADLLENATNAAEIFSQPGMLANATMGISQVTQAGLGAPIITQVGGNTSNVNSQTQVIQDMHINSRTLEYVLKTSR